MSTRFLLLASAAVLLPQWAHAQSAQPATAPTQAEVEPQAQPVASDEEESEDEVGAVVTGIRRGSVIGDIPAENVLDSRDIRATGATSISELLDAVAAQTGSARGRAGGMPVILLNGQRISGFREIRDIPPEAIERMEILPEEVALKYGYAADQRVVNIVLRRRFNATTAEVRGRTATDGDYVSSAADVSKFILSGTKRDNLALHVEGNDALFESDRNITLQPIASQPDPVDPRDARTLLGASSNVRLSGTFNRPLGKASLTLSPEVSLTRGHSFNGIATGTLDTPGGEVLRAFPDDRLKRETSSESYALGSSINGNAGKWRWSATSNLSLDNSYSRSDNGPDLSAAQVAVDGGADPLGDFGALVVLQQDRAKSTRTSFDLDGVLNGSIAELPAGNANLTLKAGGSALGIDSVTRRDGVGTSSSLSRQIVEGSASVDLPLSKRDSKFGKLTANFNAGAQQLSDFGTLTSFGGGLNWTPKNRLNLIASVTRDENAPSLQALGDPVIATQGVPYFDASNGETATVTAITGGNPDLTGDRRTVFKLGANWQPLEEPDLRLRAEYVRQDTKGPQASFPAATPALEAAFPDRFTRDADGDLVQVDLRPVSADEARREQVRVGFDFSKSLKAKPPSAADLQRLRDMLKRQGVNLPSRSGTGGAQAGAAGAGGPPQGGFGGGRRGGGGGRFGGGGRGGRLDFSLTDTITVSDWLKIAPGLPKLDYLNGEASGGTGGRPRHQVEAQGGYYNNGLGARVSANWRSATKVDGLTDAQDLKFGDYATFDLRLFANLGERLDLISRSPFFLGSSLRLEVKNIFNARPDVRDASGAVPLAYEADRIEPLGRTVQISFRKLFLPTRFFRINTSGGGGAGGPAGGGGFGPPPPGTPSPH